jgi:hypothetical protein
MGIILLLAGDLRPLCQAGQKRHCALRRAHRLEGRRERLHVSVELERALAIDLDERPVQLQSRKHATRPGIAQHLCAHLPVGIRCGMAAHRPRRHTCVSTQFELAAQQAGHALVIHDQHDEVDCLAADLQPEAAAFNGEERGIAPTLAGAAAGNAAPIASAEHESAFQHGRNHGDALG